MADKGIAGAHLLMAEELDYRPCHHCGHGMAYHVRGGSVGRMAWCAYGHADAPCGCTRWVAPPVDKPEPSMAKTIVVERVGSSASLKIDGVEFPFLISAQVIVDCTSGDVPSVTVTLLADQVLVANRLEKA